MAEDILAFRVAPQSPPAVPSGGEPFDSFAIAINGEPFTLDLYLRDEAPPHPSARAAELGRMGRCVAFLRPGKPLAMTC